MKTPKGWHKRGYLPHFDGGEITQFITFRLYDSLPQNILNSLKITVDDDKLENQRRAEKFLDQGFGECFLKIPQVAEIVQNKILSIHEKDFLLKAWIIMPNHVHLLITPCAAKSLTKIMQVIKGATAREANIFLKRTGAFWMRDYFDRYIRDYEHFVKAFNYIENNPVKAGICEKPSNWKYSSAGTERQL